MVLLQICQTNPLELIEVESDSYGPLCLKFLRLNYLANSIRYNSFTKKCGKSSHNCNTILTFTTIWEMWRKYLGENTSI